VDPKELKRLTERWRIIIRYVEKHELPAHYESDQRRRFIREMNE
jgi:hypothetical protein